jgi:hypothetical protein
MRIDRAVNVLEVEYSDEKKYFVLVMFVLLVKSVLQ